MERIDTAGVKRFETKGQDVVQILSNELDVIEAKTRAATHLEPDVIKRGVNTVNRVRDILSFRQRSFMLDYNSILSIIEQLYCTQYGDISDLDATADELASEFENQIFEHLVTDIKEPIIVRYIRFFIDFCLSQTLIPESDKKLITKTLDIVIEKRMTLVSEF
jgi:hypothetical protein